mmetsp:Transcript_72754/g.213409  ORF Transcript_72754/g.213409 Transcript_72754/m.213409 type:complete len:284 (+) Transcript_72754:83-934(+)
MPGGAPRAARPGGPGPSAGGARGARAIGQERGAPNRRERRRQGLGALAGRAGLPPRPAGPGGRRQRRRAGGPDEGAVRPRLGGDEVPPRQPRAAEVRDHDEGAGGAVHHLRDLQGGRHGAEGGPPPVRLPRPAAAARALPVEPGGRPRGEPATGRARDRQARLRQLRDPARLRARHRRPAAPPRGAAEGPRADARPRQQGLRGAGQGPVLRRRRGPRGAGLVPPPGAWPAARDGVQQAWPHRGEARARDVGGARGGPAAARGEPARAERLEVRAVRGHVPEGL